MPKQTKPTSGTPTQAGTSKRKDTKTGIDFTDFMKTPKEIREIVWELTDNVRYEFMSDILHAMADILWQLDELDNMAVIYRDRDIGAFRVMLFEEIQYSKGDPKPKDLFRFYNDSSIPDILISYGSMIKAEDQEGH